MDSKCVYNTPTVKGCECVPSSDSAGGVAWWPAGDGPGPLTPQTFLKSVVHLLSAARRPDCIRPEEERPQQRVHGRGRGL